MNTIIPYLFSSTREILIVAEVVGKQAYTPADHGMCQGNAHILTPYAHAHTHHTVTRQ